jgi:hypothetical protein
VSDDEAIAETRERLKRRLEELRPAAEESSRIQAALAALEGSGYPRPPVTALDVLKPVPPGED